MYKRQASVLVRTLREEKAAFVASVAIQAKWRGVKVRAAMALRNAAATTVQR